MGGTKSIDYAQSSKNMGDLILDEGVDFQRDFTEDERVALRDSLEAHMSRCGNSGDEELRVDLKRFELIVHGADEASYLYRLLR